MHGKAHHDAALSAFASCSTFGFVGSVLRPSCSTAEPGASETAVFTTGVHVLHRPRPFNTQHALAVGTLPLKAISLTLSYLRLLDLKTITYIHTLARPGITRRKDVVSLFWWCWWTGGGGGAWTLMMTTTMIFAYGFYGTTSHGLLRQCWHIPRIIIPWLRLCLLRYRSCIEHPRSVCAIST